MKILVFCAKGFETLEFSALIDIMGWARNDYHYLVYVHTCGLTKTVYSAFNIPILMNKTIKTNCCHLCRCLVTWKKWRIEKQKGYNISLK